MEESGYAPGAARYVNGGARRDGTQRLANRSLFDRQERIQISFVRRRPGGVPVVDAVDLEVPSVPIGRLGLKFAETLFSLVEIHERPGSEQAQTDEAGGELSWDYLSSHVPTLPGRGNRQDPIRLNAAFVLNFGITGYRDKVCFMAELRRVDRRGTVSLPVSVRRGVDLVEIVRRDDGVIELRPRLVVDQSQGWFWSNRWQAMEREADADVQEGHVKQFDDVETFLSELADDG